jgi:hypothetical protein
VEAYGYDAQKRILPEHCQRLGRRIVERNEEPGVSCASLVSRSAMMRLLEDAR